MSEIILNAVLHLFALIASARGEGAREACHASVLAYLKQQVRTGPIEPYLGLYDEFYDLALTHDDKARKQAAWALCEQLRGKLPRQEQFVVLAAVLSITSMSGAEPGIATLDGIIAAALDIDRADFDALRLLILHPGDHTGLDERFLVLDDGGLAADLTVRRLKSPGFGAGWTATRIRETGALVLVPTGPDHLTINGQLAEAGKLHMLPPGAVLRDGAGRTIYGSEIQAGLSDETGGEALTFEGRGLSFRFPGSDNGLHHFDFSERSGRLIGVMGGSGTGKSTLLSILSGGLAPDEGQVLLGGHDLYAEPEALDGVIGLVPQDDLLFDDLTVRQNLAYSARLCLADLPPTELDARVEETLANLGQLETADLKVGSPLDKTISGGQRKRLNIALELIREPAVLFADEPTSGLSSADSFNVMTLLKQQALAGRLVIVVIHQPSSEIFKLFDSLWILDKGGRPVFEGNPMQAVSTFRSAIHAAGGGEGFCPTCGNVNPEQIFDIIEMRRVDDGGRFTDQRLVSPEDWHQRHLERKAASGGGEEAPPQEVPRGLTRPGYWGQFAVFFARNLKSRLANRQYTALNLLEAPVIALLLGLLCRRSSGPEYVFADNMNIAVFFFMSVVVALFLGLSVSAEEIVRDRMILKRERFLNLSWAAYANAKTAYLTALTAVQALFFVIVAQAVLRIPDMSLATWAVLFSCGVCSCLLGLNISSVMRSAVAVYILIPLLLIPQMLLGGSVIPMHELVGRDAGSLNPPWYAELMPSRWGYEALLTRQYTGNRYMGQGRFEADCALRQTEWELDYRIQELKTLADFLFLPTRPDDFEARARRNLKVLAFETRALEAEFDLSSGLGGEVFTLETFDRDTAKQFHQFLRTVTKELRTRRRQASEGLDVVDELQGGEQGADALEALEQANTNRSVELAVNNALSLESVRISNGRLVQLTDLACVPADDPLGLAPFGAGRKRLLAWTVATEYYDLARIWELALILYLSLLFRLPERLFGRAGR